MDSPNKLYSFFVVAVPLIVVGFVLYLTWRTLAGFTVWLQSLESQVAAAVVASTGTIAAGVIAVIISQQIAKGREIAEAHRHNKVAVYDGFVKKVVEYMQRTKADVLSAEAAPVPPEDLEYFIRFHTDLMIWGSPQVIQAYHAFRNVTAQRNKSKSVILAMEDVLRAMRRDLGHNDWRLRRGQLILIFITNDGADELLS